MGDRPLHQTHISTIKSLGDTSLLGFLAHGHRHLIPTARAYRVDRFAGPDECKMSCADVPTSHGREDIAAASLIGIAWLACVHMHDARNSQNLAMLAPCGNADVFPQTSMLLY